MSAQFAKGDLIEHPNFGQGVVDELIAEPFIRHGIAGTAKRTRAELKSDLHRYRQALGKPVIEVRDRVVDGNKVQGAVFESKQENTELIDLERQFVMPGFIEGHGHFSGLGGSLMNLNFLRSKSWDEIVAMVAEKVKTAEPGEWITGRGWHQEKWIVPIDEHVHGYPDHEKLSEVSPDNPVLLRHASGHSLFANAKAMEMAGVSKETPNPSSGTIAGPLVSYRGGSSALTVTTGCGSMYL